ncbi:LacI family DNA-binding transcriptional regulator [Paracoccus aerius]|uniref:LacI family DNA-binding transcriptional regulator n=2 Tax=Paracoccus aerius TaxID=1915382 RepID=A0ABS1SB39_9RHOB|nr:LacI family DNA-binding transcriptional regulator [Paracoccus aerius]MBL3675764.1 LacI family DNA-binding transcriptional regulator [Paracoccus aerius]
MRDVAAEAGVAAITVSRALSSPDRVSPHLLEKVQAAAKKLQYTPNIAAGTLRSQKSRIVAVIVPTIAHSIFAETIQVMSGIFRPAGYHLLIGHSGYSLEEEESLVTAFLARKPDAIILTGYTHSATTIDLIARAEVPLVEIWNIPDEPRDTVVGISNFDAAQAMTRLLIRKGYRKIGYIGGPRENNDRVEQRERGFAAALQEAGLEVPERGIVRKPLEFENGARALTELLSQNSELDAVFAASDILAIGVLMECQNQGIRVPEQLAVVGFDDVGLASYTSPPLTTVRVPREEIGRRAAQEVLKRLSGGSTEPRIIDLGFEIIERRSA